MPKFLIVARQEYAKAVRSKAFLIGVLLMPLLMGGGFIVIGLAGVIHFFGQLSHFLLHSLRNTGVLSEGQGYRSFRDTGLLSYILHGYTGGCGRFFGTHDRISLTG